MNAKAFGVGILVGLSLFKSTELGDGVAANPGDTWSTAGALPTKEVFNRQSLGLMLAATLDVEILQGQRPAGEGSAAGG